MISDQAKIWMFRAVMIAILISAVVLAEFAAGRFQNVNTIRSETKRFVTEAVPLITYTQRLQPDLKDEFINEQSGYEARRLFRTDSHGFVLGPKDVTYSKSTTSILFLGGSTTENNEVDEQYRFPFLAPFQLSKLTGQSFDGLNAGVRGHTSYESLNLYLNHPSPRIQEAAIVVVMHNINDRLRLTLNESYRSPFLNSSDSSVEGVQEAAKGLSYSTWEWARLSSNLLFLLDTAVDKFIRPEEVDGIAVNERALDAYSGVALRRVNEYEQSIRNLIAIIKANRQIPVLMTQPLGRDSTDQAEFNNVIRRIADEESVALIDLSSAIEGLSERQALFYDDDIHFNNAGSKWASDEIAKGLVKLFDTETAVSKPTSRACPDILVNKKSLISNSLYRDVLNGRYPSFDSAEKRILFQKNTSEQSEISVLDVETGTVQTIAASRVPVVLEHPTWLDDKRVLFTERAGEDRRLVILEFEVNVKAPLLKDQELQGAIANVGPNGVVYFAGYRHRDQGPPILYKVQLDGRSPVPLTKTGNESWRPFVAASGDLYYINNESGRYQIYVKRGGDSSTAQMQLFPSDHEQWDPAISNDGRMLAFAQREGGNFDIYLSRFGKAEKKPVRLVGSAEDEWDPRFSPSGRYLLYAATSPYGDQIRAVCLDE